MIRSQPWVFPLVFIALPGGTSNIFVSGSLRNLFMIPHLEEEPTPPRDPAVDGSGWHGEDRMPRGLQVSPEDRVTAA